MTTIFEDVLTYIQIADIGNTIFRQNLIKFNIYKGCSTVDNYRNYLTQAGYLCRIYSGAYKYVKKIPHNLTYKQLLKEAYPNSEWTKIL